MQTRVLPPLLCIALVAGCGSVSRQTFVALDQSARAIIVALDGTPKLPQFRPLRQSFATQLTATRPRARSSSDRALIADYDAVDARLGEMLSLWEGLVEREAELLPLSDALPERLRLRYDLPVNSNEPRSIYASEALRALRDDIAHRLGAASDLVNR